MGRGIQGTGHRVRDVKLRDVEQEVEQDVEHCDRRRRRTHSARTRTAWAELGSKDEDGLGSNEKEDSGSEDTDMSQAGRFLPK